MPYFDWNATAPLHPKAREAWLEASESAWGNPSTAYRLGTRARAKLDEAREELAGMLGFETEQLVFTSGATEANNGFIRELARVAPDREIWVSSVEHPSVDQAAQHYWGSARVRRIPVSGEGVVDLDWVQYGLRESRPGLICVMAVNNETGVIQPWNELGEICANAGVPYLCDAVQWIGKEPSPLGTPCSVLVLSGHKFGGPKGVGALVLGPEWSGLKILAGGEQEMASRAGTENIPAILAMVAALKARQEAALPHGQRQARDDFEESIRKEWGGEIRIHGSGTGRIWNTCSISLPEYRSERWITLLDREGIQVSSGSACSTGKEGPSSILKAMGVDEETARRTLRISSGWETTPDDWKDLLRALVKIRRTLDSQRGDTGPGKVIQI